MFLLVANWQDQSTEVTRDATIMAKVLQVNVDDNNNNNNNKDNANEDEILLAESEESRQWSDNKWSIDSRAAACHAPQVVRIQLSQWRFQGCFQRERRHHGVSELFRNQVSGLWTSHNTTTFRQSYRESLHNMSICWHSDLISDNAAHD